MDGRVIFSKSLLQQIGLQAEVRIHPLQPAVLIFPGLHHADQRRIHAAILRPPAKADCRPRSPKHHRARNWPQNRRTTRTLHPERLHRRCRFICTLCVPPKRSKNTHRRGAVKCLKPKRHLHPLRTWATKLARRRGAKRAMVALAWRIAVSTSASILRWFMPAEDAGSRLLPA